MTSPARLVTAEELFNYPDPKRYELKLKGDTSGRTYLGFEAPPGDPQDREVLSSTDSLMIMRFVDPNAHGRYGTFVYVRCGA